MIDDASRRTGLPALAALGTAAALGLTLTVNLLAAASPQPPAAPSSPDARQLLIVVDGLRPDHVTPDLMPRLSALAARGVRFSRHHAVFPTVTRVNAASFTTGAYPEVHGLLGNSVYRPTVDPAAFLDTGDRADLDRITAVEPLLDATTLGEAVQVVGRRLLVVSSGSAGSALVNNPTIAGGAVLHRDVTRPAALEAAMQALPSRRGPQASRAALDAHAVDAFFEVGLPRVDPAITVLWLGALDGTAHAHGVGDPRTLDVLRRVDAQIGRVEDGLAVRGMLEAYTIWVSSDHGFSTHTGAPDVSAVLAPLTRTMPDGRPSIVAGGGAIYVREPDAAVRREVVARIVTGLQRTPGVGPIFTAATRAGALDGDVPGTLSFDAIRWRHARSADVLFAPEWTDAANAHGWTGTTASAGAAGHGSASPWDIHNTLIATGRGVARGLIVEVPSANVDLAPTLLTLLGVPVPRTAQGRVLHEGLAGAPQSPAPGAAAPRVESISHTVRSSDGAYAAAATWSVVDANGVLFRYLDRITATRRPVGASREGAVEGKR